MKPGEITYRPTTGAPVELTSATAEDLRDRLDDMDLAVLAAKLDLLTRRAIRASRPTEPDHSQRTAPAGWSSTDDNPFR